jgi:hypothetical protein
MMVFQILFKKKTAPDSRQHKYQLDWHMDNVEFECAVCLAPCCEGQLWNSCPSLFPSSAYPRGVCEVCVDTFLTSQVEQNEIHGDGSIECICANSSCENKFKREFIIGRLQGADDDQNILSKYERFAASAAIECDPTKKWCPRPGCNNAANVISSKRALCDKCNLSFCGKCGNDHSCWIDCSMVGCHSPSPVIFHDAVFRLLTETFSTGRAPPRKDARGVLIVASLSRRTGDADT